MLFLNWFFVFCCFVVSRVTRAVNVMGSGIIIVISQRAMVDALFLRSS